MNGERWQQLNSIFQRALDVPAERRAAFVTAETAGDTELISEIEELLLSHEQEDDFLNQNHFAALITENETPKQIGNYKIIREIGRGGMGVVYLAERADNFSQKVALKIIKRGMDTDEIVRRFRQERQILAALNHPHIARLLDGGTTDDGLPFLVMEYVEGETIDRFCAEQNLTLNQRLELFRKISAAVAFAHQNLVVHRDLKPSNILVAADGTPKLLDFGIAKILSETEENQTSTVTQIFTPDYASPEQLRGERATTGTDIYSLGVILSELVLRQSSFVNRPSSNENSTSPNKRRTTDEGRRTKKLNADLKKILAKAMSEEPARRYQSVLQFGDDVRRFLEGLPVSAQRDTFRYRAQKFVLRHRAGVLAAALILLSLVGGFSVAVWQARIARIERAKAERRFNEVRQIANSFLFEFHDAVKNVPGAFEARKLVVTKGLEYLDNLASEVETKDADLLRELATAYTRVGQVQAETLKDAGGALRSYLRAAEIDRKILLRAPHEVYAKKALGNDLFKQTEILTAQKRYADALPVYQEILLIRLALLGDEPENLRHLTDVSQDYERLADNFSSLKRPTEAEQARRSALQTIERRIRLGEQTAATPEEKTELSFALLGRGDLLGVFNDWQAAAESYEKAGEIAEAVFRENPNLIQALRNTTAAHNRTGNALAEIGDFQGALQNFRFSLDLIKNAVRQNPHDRQFREAECYYLVKVAVFLEKTGAKNESLATLENGLALREKLTADDKSNGVSMLYHAELFEQGGDLLVKLNQTEKARQIYRRALQLCEKTAQEESANARERLQEKLSALQK